jgi:hypothetical protein
MTNISVVTVFPSADIAVQYCFGLRSDPWRRISANMSGMDFHNQDVEPMSLSRSSANAPTIAIDPSATLSDAAIDPRMPPEQNRRASVVPSGDGGGGVARLTVVRLPTGVTETHTKG